MQYYTQTVLTIAGSDSGAGAGIQADLKTFSAFGVYGTTAITAVTAQNTRGVEGVLELPADFVAKQIDAVMKDIKPEVWKTGMLANSEIIDTLVERAKYYDIKFLVVDPVMISKSGKTLLPGKAKTSLIDNLIPLSLVITPNCTEAEVLTGHTIHDIKDMENAAKVIYGMGAKNVVIKGGHLDKKYDAIDIFYDGYKFTEIKSKRIITKNTHGTGCTFASAIAAGIALGHSPISAVKNAKKYIFASIKKAVTLRIGQGYGPLIH